MQDNSPSSIRQQNRSRFADSPLVWSLLFAFIAALLAFQPLTRIAYLKLFGKPETLIQEPITDGVPIPRDLTWSPFTQNLISSLGTITSAAVLAIGIALCSAFAYALLRILNPSFRLTTGVDWNEKVLVKTYMHTPPVIKAFLIAVGAVLPGMLMWQAIHFALGGRSIALPIQLALTGAGIWLLFSRDGIAGDFENLNYEFPRDRGVAASLSLRGATAGLVLWLIAALPPRVSPESLFSFFRGLGGLGEGHWWKIAEIWLGLAAGVGFGCGGLAVALGRPALELSGRLRAAALPAVVLGVTMYAGRYGLPDHFRSRYDFDPDAKASAAQRLAETAGLKATSSSGYDVLVMGQGRSERLRFHQSSVSGVDASPDSAEKVDAFLKKRDYSTTLAYPAFVTLYDATSLAWDTDASIRAAFLNLTRCPEPGTLRILFDKLATTAATPAALKYVSEVASDQVFHFPERQSEVLMGDVFAHLGERAKAESWYRRAMMPPLQVKTHADEQLKFTGGSVDGRLTLNGIPLLNTKVAVAPMRAWRHLDSLTDATRGISPFWLWWISASTTTDDQGRFNIDRLVEGSYFLLVRIPESKSVISESRLAGIILRSDIPHFDVGEIHLSTAATPVSISSGPQRSR